MYKTSTDYEQLWGLVKDGDNRTIIAYHSVTCPMTGHDETHVSTLSNIFDIRLWREFYADRSGETFIATCQLVELRWIIPHDMEEL